jgi:hypothetical protein
MRIPVSSVACRQPGTSAERRSHEHIAADVKACARERLFCRVKSRPHALEERRRAVHRRAVRFDQDHVHIVLAVCGETHRRPRQLALRIGDTTFQRFATL